MKRFPLRRTRPAARLRSAIVTAGAAAVLTIGSALLGINGASASVAPHGASASHYSGHANSARVSPDTNNLITYLTNSISGGGLAFACLKYADYPNPRFIWWADNNCEYHVYLQYSNGSSTCIDPHSLVEVRTFPATIQIGPGTSDC